MSLTRLILWTVIDLLLVILIGAAGTAIGLYIAEGKLGVLCAAKALGLPVAIEEEAAKWHHRYNRKYTPLPEDDEKLRAWFLAQKGVEDLKIERKTTVDVRVRCRGPKGLTELEPPWEELGYGSPKTGESSESSWSVMLGMPDDKEMLLIELGFLQLGLLVVGLFRLWRVSKIPAGEPTFPEAPVRFSPAAYLLTVVGLAAFVWLHDQLLRFWLGPPRLTGGPFAGLLGFSDGEISNRFRLSMRESLAVAALLVPSLCQELFFRAGLFAMWSRSGRPWTGAIISALAFAALRLDPYHIPAAVAIGLVLAWIYQRTRSFLLTWLAHLAVSAVTLGLLLGMIPGLPHPHDRILGEWEILDGQTGRWTFTPDGKILAWSVHKMPFGEEIKEQETGRYYFTDDDHIEFRFRMLGIWITVPVEIDLTEDEMTATMGDPVRTLHLKRVSNTESP